MAHAVGQLAGGSILIAVHGAELRAVGGFQLGAGAVVDAQILSFQPTMIETLRPKLLHLVESFIPKYG